VSQRGEKKGEGGVYPLVKQIYPQPQLSLGSEKG